MNIIYNCYMYWTNIKTTQKARASPVIWQGNGKFFHGMVSCPLSQQGGWFHWHVSNFMATKTPPIAALPPKGDDDALAQWRSLAPLLGMAVLHSKLKGQKGIIRILFGANSCFGSRNSIDFLVCIVKSNTFLRPFVQSWIFDKPNEKMWVFLGEFGLSYSPSQ